MKLHEFLTRALRTPVYAGTGRIVAIEPELLGNEERRDGVMRAINKISLRTLRAEDVHVRGMNAANNVIDYYDSRFTEKGLRQASKIYAGTAMAAGHDMTRMPLATVFAGDMLENTSGSRVKELRDVGLASWLRGLFYWSRALSYASDLAESIDTGIQREVSLHWMFTDATCGICETDIRQCEHFPGEEYDGKRCWYEMEGVTDILETSFVIKGGQRGTSLWQPTEMNQAASVMDFGRAIRELKSDKQAFSDWKRSLDPSSGAKAPRQMNGAARFLGTGLKLPTA